MVSETVLNMNNNTQASASKYTSECELERYKQAQANIFPVGLGYLIIIRQIC